MMSGVFVKSFIVTALSASLLLSSAVNAEHVFRSGDLKGGKRAYIYRTVEQGDFAMKVVYVPEGVDVALKNKMLIWEKISQCKPFQATYRDPFTLVDVVYVSNPDCSFSIDAGDLGKVSDCNISQSALISLDEALKADASELMGFEALTPYERIMMSTPDVCKVDEG